MGAPDEPTSDTIGADGGVITEVSDRRLVRYPGRSIGFVLESYNLVPSLSARDNVMLPMEFAGVGREARSERAAELLHQVGLARAKQASTADVTCELEDGRPVPSGVLAH